MKNFLTIVVSVLLSIVAVWFLLPTMQEYHEKKTEQTVSTTQSQPQQEKQKTEKAKTTKTKATSKPKTKPTTKPQTAQPVSNGKDVITVKIVSLDRLYVRYSLRNNTNQSIQELKLRILYFDKDGEQMHYEDVRKYHPLEPGLTKSFEEWRPDESKGAESVKIQIVSYKF